MTRESLHAFIDGLALPADAKARLKALTPATYIGLAADARAARLTRGRGDGAAARAQRRRSPRARALASRTS